MIAASTGNDDVVKLFLHFGCDPRKQDRHGRGLWQFSTRPQVADVIRDWEREHNEILEKTKVVVRRKTADRHRLGGTP